MGANSHSPYSKAPENVDIVENVNTKLVEKKRSFC